MVRLDEVQLLRVVPERLEISRVHPSHRRARRSHLFAVVHRRVEALVEPVSRRDGVLAAPARDEISVSTKPVPRRDVPRRRPRPRTRGRLPGSPAKLRTAPVHHAAAVDRAQSPREKRHHLLVESLKREDVFASARVQKLRKRVAVIAAVRGEMRTLPVVHPAPARARGRIARGGGRRPRRRRRRVPAEPRRGSRATTRRRRRRGFAFRHDTLRLFRRKTRLANRRYGLRLGLPLGRLVRVGARVRLFLGLLARVGVVLPRLRRSLRVPARRKVSLGVAHEARHQSIILHAIQSEIYVPREAGARVSLVLRVRGVAFGLGHVGVVDDVEKLRHRAGVRVALDAERARDEFGRGYVVHGALDVPHGGIVHGLVAVRPLLLDARAEVDAVVGCDGLDGGAASLGDVDEAEARGGPPALAPGSRGVGAEARGWDAGNRCASGGDGDENHRGERGERGGERRARHGGGRRPSVRAGARRVRRGAVDAASRVVRGMHQRRTLPVQRRHADGHGCCAVSRDTMWRGDPVGRAGCWTESARPAARRHM